MPHRRHCGLQTLIGCHIYQQRKVAVRNDTVNLNCHWEAAVTPLTQNAPLAGFRPRTEGFLGRLVRSLAGLLYLKSGGREFKWLRRELRGRFLAKCLKKERRRFDPSGGTRLIAKAEGVNGLSRAYRYEIARLASSGGNFLACAPEAASNFLILGQPKDYWKLLSSPPKGFQSGYRIGLLVTEFDAPPRGWDFVFDILHEIWTPSSFSARAIREASGLPVKVVPHAVSIPNVRPLEREHFHVERGQFLGMAIMDLSSCPDRKNPLAHVKAWKLAFGNDPSARLLIKVRFSKYTQYVRMELIEEIGTAQNITLTECEFSDHGMSAFQKMADVYLSLHRAEGYGLNIHEMLEIGTPVVATGWSGNMDYMPYYRNANPVPYKLVPYRDPTIYYKGDGLFWAEADIDAAASTLLGIRQQWDAERRGGARPKVFSTAGPDFIRAAA
jgi:glycosyltransferase involved in cell wall biosynthesis